MVEKTLKIKIREAKEYEKCPGCNWKTINLYGFTCNPDNEMLCGECFSQMLAEEQYEIRTKET